MTDEQKAKCHKIADHYGDEHQMLKTVEEMAELSQVIIKAVNDPPNDKFHAETMKDEMLNELADVIIMTEQLVKYVSDNDCATILDGIINMKLNRQLKRMESESNA
jgi:NTP pyrophosphatase (non-canonical NTP hydrolase)